MDGRLGTAPDRSNLVLLAAQLIVEEALEAEVRDEVGRERYERADGEASGYRNGYRTGRMKTAEGVVEFAAPRAGCRRATSRRCLPMTLARAC
jgi:transposase-like protein